MRTPSDVEKELYADLASWYDEIYSFKDTARESREILHILRRNVRGPLRTLLDVACGTGRHLAYLSRTLRCMGLDESRAMLRVARRRAPRSRFVRGRMEDFDLGEQFDAIICLFSAIGYVETYDGLRRTFQTFARHLRPGGVLVIEPWLSPEAYHPGALDLLVVERKKRKAARMSVSRLVRGRSVIDMHYLVGDARGVRYFREQHVGGLFDHSRTLRLLHATGFRARFRRSGFTPDRGLFVGVRLSSG